MTFSIVARSGDALGVATATRSLAVGAVVPAAAPATGALATQARTNRGFRSSGLRLMRDGVAPRDVLAALEREDVGFDQRQVALVDASGRGAVWTGPECLPWAGGWSRDGVAVAGNLLVGREVLEAMDAAFAAEPDAPLSRRLLAALTAGDGAGGDRRGRQSAALVVVAGADDGAWPPTTRVDLRVDDHPDPVGELARLVALAEVEVATAEPAEAVPEGERGAAAGAGPDTVTSPPAP
ncbi:DUF1028 domain-containing protein [Georgenia sp. H159]|uniref:DUF1028 domain-containing protein n=1 Tax=Georgenia sp. H159 TaxID=3076115 RepID=UPI002D7876F4|nr:DUF1028 domain-containing protein [Georgenia sp. H159]